MIEQKILQDFRWLNFIGVEGLAWFSSDGTRYVRPFVIFRDCIQKVVQFTEPAVINYGLCGKFKKFRASRTRPTDVNYDFVQCSKIIITSWVSNDQSSTLPWYWIHHLDITWQIQHATEQIYDAWISFEKFQVFRFTSGQVFYSTNIFFSIHRSR